LWADHPAHTANKSHFSAPKAEVGFLEAATSAVLRGVYAWDVASGLHSFPQWRVK